MANLQPEDIDLAPLIDHALLKPGTTDAMVKQGCDEAILFGFATVCVYPIHVRLAADLLHGKETKVCTVIGFPSGMVTSAVKLHEAQEATENGATELDVVINLSWVKSGQMDAIYQELAEICEATDRTVKAILETTLLTEEEKRAAAEICMESGAAFLKTSTGWMGGATVADVRLLKEITRDRIGLKASGGIRTANQAVELVMAGATRLGTSRGPEIIRQRDRAGKDAYDGEYY